MPRIRLLPLLAAILLVLACATSAQAGQYTLAYDFGTDLSGWSGYVEPSYLLCGSGATSGCPDATTSRIMARSGVGQPLWSQGRWEWTAPPGTTIAGGALAYRTRMRDPEFYARVKTRADGVAWELSPTLVNEQQTAALTDHVLPLAAGFRQIGVSLYSHPAVAGVVSGVWDDYLTLVRLDVTVDDPTPPSLSWADGGALLDGGWHNSDVCGTLAVADGQSGVGTAWLESGGISSSWAAPRTGSQYQPGIPSAQPTLCLSAAALGDGLHAGTAGAGDVSTGQATPLAFSVAIDATPPTAAIVSPAPAGSGPLPVVSLNVADNLSGVASVLAQVDGTTVPLTLAGATASGTPVAALAYGPHTLAWSVVDGAGNRTSSTATFAVADSTPPAFGSPQPANGAMLDAGDVLAVAVTASDGDSGLDPAATALTLDGAPIDHVWQADGLIQGVSASRLAAGSHHLELRVADRAGNASRLVWDISVPVPPPSGGSAPATVVPATGGAVVTPSAVPAAPMRHAAVTVRAVVARISGPRARSLVVHLLARPHLRIVLRVQCGALVHTRRVRADRHGIAALRVACAGVATVRMVARPGRLLVHIAARRLPLVLHVRPDQRAAPTVARVSGRLAELRGRIVVIEALTKNGWRRAGAARADAAGRFSTSFAIVHAGQFALRARVGALAGAASAPFVLTMR
ncbi:MAG TPA: hypothetical protein VGK92_00160 [Gaiellales bacterium]|jgi:hypothetical protein